MTRTTTSQESNVAPPAPEPEKVTQSKQDDPDEHHIPHNNLPLVFLALMLTAFLDALDQSIFTTALPTIVAQLGGGSAYSWVGSAYLIGAAAATPVCGKLSDIFSRKNILFPCIVIFLVGSALCGAAQSMTWLVIARAIQGIGGGGTQVMVSVVIGDIFSLKDRGKYGSWIGAMWGIAGVLGPVIGGASSDRPSLMALGLLDQPVSLFQPIIYMLTGHRPTGGVAGLMLLFFLNLNPHEGRSLREHMQQFDFGGLVLFVGGVVSLLLGFSNSQNGWNRASTIVPLVIGFAAIVAGIFFEAWTSRSPLIPPRLFRTRTTAIIFVTVFLHSFCFFCAPYYLPLYFQILGASSTKSGVLLIPLSLLSSATSSVGGIIVSIMGDYRPVLWVGFGIMAIGYGLMIMLDEKSSLWVLFVCALQLVYSSIAGIGFGFPFVPPLIGMQAAMPERDMATSTSTFGLFRILGSTVGIAIGQTVWSSVSRRQLAKISGLPLDLVGAGLADSVKEIQSIEPDSLREQVRHAYTSGVSAIWIMDTPIIVVCFVAVFFLKKYSLSRKVVRTGGNGAPEVIPEGDNSSDVEKQAEVDAPEGKDEAQVRQNVLSV
ncbi:MFS general substrate transporter [Mycena chlorophos]|uniref:MFS general substrate transporter n=1 Tax=Mycena chlorophos TaxID=658473 RepID=A0A8H6T8X4_MYCCL|nr:MFS general substrate transporter [Mycena chlorophos]